MEFQTRKVCRLLTSFDNLKHVLVVVVAVSHAQGSITIALQPATARQLGTSTTRTGGTILSYISSNVFVNPPPLVGHKDMYYAINFDDMPGPDNIILDDLMEEEKTGQSTVITGTNIQVVPPAKRYHNSVRVTPTYHQRDDLIYL